MTDVAAWLAVRCSFFDKWNHQLCQAYWLLSTCFLKLLHKLFTSISRLRQCKSIICGLWKGGLNKSWFIISQQLWVIVNKTRQYSFQSNQILNAYTAFILKPLQQIYGYTIHKKYVYELKISFNLKMNGTRLKIRIYQRLLRL